MVVRWVFDDLTTLETYTFVVNPATDERQEHQKNATITNTSAPGGNALIMEGRETVKEGSFAGVIFTEAEYNVFDNWARRRHQIQLTDDLGRVQIMIMKSFQATRRRSHNHPWAHDYTIEYWIVDW